MKIVDIADHDFSKINLATTPKGDLYKCSICGVSGYRSGLQPLIKLTERSYKQSLKCTFTPFERTVNRPKEVMTDNLPYIGLEHGIHKVVDCPKEHINFKNDVWVFSKQRNEPVRLFPNEYEIVTP